MTKTFLPIITTAAVAVAGVPAAAPAAAAQNDHNRAEAAMTKGIRDYARVVADGAKVSRISVDAKAVDRVGEKHAVKGTFRLTKDGRTVTYRLTSKARVLRLSPSAIEYRVSARATERAAGLPKSTGAFSGFFQGPAARER
jgi:hypothetical protein